jgi:hypothetical protein
MGKKALPSPGSNKVMSGKERNTGRTKPFSIPLATLNPTQAFSAFYSSFDNLKDDHRPMWTVNDRVAGFGIIITTPNLSAFNNLATTLAQFMNFKELGEGLKTVTKDIHLALSDAKSQGHDLRSDTTFDLSKFTLDMTDPMGTNKLFKSKNMGEVLTSLESLLESTSVKGYRWAGLSLRNFPLIQQVTSYIEGMLKTLSSSLVAPSTNPITDIIEAVKKKLVEIKKIVELADQVATTILTSLEYTGIYCFAVPPDYGGVQYIKDSIGNSLKLKSNPIFPVMTTSTFTVLIFAGAAIGVNSDAWVKMLEGTFNMAKDKMEANFDSLGNPVSAHPFKYKVNPDFAKEIFNYDQPFILSVSAPMITKKTPCYFTYSIQDSNGTVLFENKEKNILKGSICTVNESQVSITLPPNKGKPKTVKFHVNITIFDGNLLGIEYSTDFTVSDILPTGLPVIAKGGDKDTECKLATSNLSIKVKSKGRIIETLYVAKGTCIPDYLSRVKKYHPPVTVEITDDTPTTIIIPIDVYVPGATIDLILPDDLDKLRFMRLTEVPTWLCFKNKGILIYHLVRQPDIVVNLPACISISTPGIYEFTYIDDTVVPHVTYGPYLINFTVSDPNLVKLC